MAPLRLFVLGPPRLERDGRPVELNLRRALALLVYLAVDDRPHGREALAALLWPDSDEPEARGRLRRTLHRLTRGAGGRRPGGRRRHPPPVARAGPLAGQPGLRSTTPRPAWPPRRRRLRSPSGSST